MLKNVIFFIICMFLQAHGDDRIVGEIAANITKAINESAKASVSVVAENIALYEAYTTNYTHQVVSTSVKEISTRMSSFKLELQSMFDNNIVLNCLKEEGRFEYLVQEITNEVTNCARIAAMEATNVISDSLNEAQVFMTIPEVLYNDLQQCGLSAICLEKIAFDAIQQSILVPSKVMVLAGRIQEIVIRTMTSVDGCTLRAMHGITKQAIGIFEDVLFCINDEL